MARNFKELRKEMSLQAGARSKVAARKMIQALPVARLRDARNRTRVNVARRLNIDQSAVSMIERGTDMYLSTLSDVIRAMGGELELTAKFRSGEIHIVTLAGSETRGELALIHGKR